MTPDLSGKKIVLTGITGGIARATAETLLALGAELIVTARSDEKLDAALAGLSGPVSGQVMDLLKPDDIARTFEAVGRFDHLVTPASTGMFAPLADMDLAAARELLDSKQWGQMLCVRHAARNIARDGSITLFSGTVTQKVMPGATMFAAVGAATEAAGRTWAAELAPVRVNTIVPGIIDTPVWTGLMGEDGARGALASFAEALPVGRVGTAEDIAKAVVFLIDSGFVSGISLVVDGGHRLI